MSQENRRSFLRKASLAAPAIIGLNSSVQAQAAREGKVGVALCGLGGFSEKSIAPEFQFAQNVWFAGVITGKADKGKAWAAKYGFSEQSVYSYADMPKLADNRDIQIVHVATPNSLHAEHSIAAAAAGKNVMCEKPMATTVEQCDAMIAAAAKAKVYLGVNYRLHWEPHHVKAVEALRSGAVGDLVNGNYEFSWGYAGALSKPAAAKSIKQWLLDAKLAGGGALFDTGVYPVQAACYLTGKQPVSVRAFPATRHPKLFPEGVEETMSFELMFEDGFQALCRASYGSNYSQCTTLGLGGQVEILPGDPGSVFGQSGGGKTNGKKLFINKKEVAAENTYQQAVLLDEFAKAIAAQAPFKTDGAMGRRDVQILRAAYESVKQGGASVVIQYS
jgi:glucose-fructose oxidoreductase